MLETVDSQALRHGGTSVSPENAANLTLADGVIERQLSKKHWNTLRFERPVLAQSRPERSPVSGKTL